MSGHSKWAQIKRQKHTTDQKRGNLFTKLTNAITVAARQGGSDAASNFKLRLAMDKAKEANMPSENIDRAIKKGTSALEGVKIEEITYEGFGPGGVAFVIEALTDNKNRTTAEVRNILEKYQGGLGQAGSVSWNFEKIGVIRIARENIKDKEALELKIIEAGAEDIFDEADGIIIHTKPEGLNKVKESLITNNIPLASAEIEFVAKNKKKIEDKNISEAINKLFIDLEENESVSNYYTDAEI